MNDQDYIRAGIELADGWEYDDDIHNKVWVRPDHYAYANNDDSQQIYLDALAAQLIRQVDALPDYFVSTTEGVAMVHKQLNDNTDRSEGYYEMDGDDRIMVTIKAIVDSKVLVGGE